MEHTTDILVVKTHLNYTYFNRPVTKQTGSLAGEPLKKDQRRPQTDLCQSRTHAAEQFMPAEQLQSWVET